MGLLLGAGVALPGAHELASQAIGNRLLRDHYKKIIPKLREGRKLSDSLSNTPFLPPIFLRIIAIGEKSGKLAQSCADAAELIERRANNRLEKFLTLLTPFMTIFLGLVVAFVVGALFLGILSLTEIEF